MKVFYAYAIRSHFHGRTYIGQTNDLNKRLQSHNSGHVRSTAKDRPWELLAIEEFDTREEARWLERQLKKSRGKREAWINAHYVQSIQLGEGKRRYEKHFISKLSDADAEQLETQHWIIIAQDCEYLTHEQFESLKQKLSEI